MKFTYKYNMSKNRILEEDKPYYMVYLDRPFLKNIYAQLYVDFPDIGVIAYVGANTYREAYDYSVDGEQENSDESRKSLEEIKQDKNLRNGVRGRAGMNFSTSNEKSEIIEHANISEIKDMNNMLFYKHITSGILNACKRRSLSNKICYIAGRINLYDGYDKDKNDVFVNVNNECVWLKKANLDMELDMIDVIGEVNMIGYVVEEETKTKPRIIKALAIYV